MVTRRKWTKEDDLLLRKEVENYPYARQKAFEEAAKKLNRTKTACHYRWYYELSNPESKHYVGCIFTLLAKKAVVNNRTYKNNSYSTPIKPKRGIWDRIKELLGIDK